MFSHCQSVSESFMFLIICQSVSQWVIYVPHHLSVSESVSHLCSSFVCQWVSESVRHFMFSICQSVSHFMFSHCQSVSESFLFLIICLSVSQWVIYVPHHLSVSESVSHLCSSSVCQWVSEAFYVQYLSVSESFYVQYLSVSRLVILCSVSVCQSVSQSFYVQYLSVSQSFYVQYLLVSQLVNYLIRQKDTERNSQINKLTKLDKQKDTQTKRWFSVHQSVT